MKTAQAPSVETALRQAARALEQGRLAEATDLALAAHQGFMRRSAGTVALHAELAALLQHLGRGHEAVEVLLTAQKALPEDAALYLQLGRILAAAGHWQGAQTCFATRCALLPGDAASQYNHGVALQELQRTPEAISAFERAITLDPGHAAAFHAMGLAYLGLGAVESALMAFDLACAADPADARFPLERARALLKTGQPAQALAVLDDLLARQPHVAEALNVKGVALTRLYRREEALAAYDEALGLRPQFADALVNRGNLRLDQRAFALALADFDAALRLAPDAEGLAGMRLYTAMHLHRWEDIEQTVSTLIGSIELGRPSVQPLALQYLVDDPAVQQKAARAWAASMPRPGSPWQRAPGARKPGRIRVGYVSRDFRSHPVSFLMAEVLELHDRERFEVIALSDGAVAQDAMQDRLRAAVDQFYDIEGLPDPRVAELARYLDLDIAVDLSGFTGKARASLFLGRLAPVQVLYLGYLGTSGSAHYDYVVADRLTVTPQTRPCYDESVISLPWYQANDRRRPRPARHASRAALGLPETGFVFCSFNNPSKLTASTFDAWCQILAQVPGSVLWLLGEDTAAEDNLRRHAGARGIDPARLVFAGRTSREAYLANLATADLFLDTLPYNAGTTASDALWMGLPVLTQAGRSFAGRVAASVLTAAGLPELITITQAQYVALATRLALQPDELARIQHRLETQRDTCPLFDAPAFTAHLELAFEEAHRRHEAGEPPGDIEVGARCSLRPPAAVPA